MINKTILLFLTISLSGCVGMYIPTAPNVPLITEKDEANISLGASLNDVAIKGSYAIDEKHALLGGANFSYGTFTKYDNLFNIVERYELEIENGESTYKAMQAELGFGNYFSLKENKIYEIYGGAGYGHTKTETNQQMDYASLFIQNNYGLKKEHIEVALCWKFSYTYFFLNEQHLSGYEIDTYFPGLTNQVSLMTRFGKGHLKAWVSPGLAYTYLFINSDENEYGITPKDFSSRYHITFGANYNF